MNTIKWEDLKRNDKVTIKIDDCCVEGTISLTFLEMVFEDTDEEKEYPTIVFEEGSFSNARCMEVLLKICVPLN
jgi:hypothetical protein